MNVDAILPAGGRISGEFALEAGAEVKALIPIDGRTMLERTLDTLRATGRIERVILIGPGEVAEHPAARLADAVLPEGGDSGPANILHGLEWLRENDGRHADRVLILTTDLPFVTSNAINAFLDSCPADIDLCAPIIRREAFEERFPGSENEYVKLRDGEWTMGCSFLVNPEALERNRRHIEQVFAARKSQLGMVRLLGFMFIARFVFGRLTVRHIEERCRSLLGCSGQGILGSPPELAFDIDKIDEYRYAVNEAAKA